MKIQKIFFLSLLVLGITSCRTVTNYERIVNTGYKETKEYNTYAAGNGIELLEKKDKVYFNSLSESEKEEIFPEYPEKPGAVKKFLYNFIKIDFEKTGKESSDEKNNKTTYPKLFGLEKTKEILNDYTEKAKQLIKENFENAEILAELADYVSNRGE